MEEDLESDYKLEIEELINGVRRYNLDRLFERVAQLSDKGQKEFMEFLYASGLEAFKKIAKREKMDNCNHQFGKWKDTSYSYYKTDTIKEEPIDCRYTNKLESKEEVEITRWTHTCKKCGYEESIDHIPEEVVNERNDKKRKNEIKRLEKKLEELKNEEN